MTKQTKKSTKNSVTHKASSADVVNPTYVDLERKQVLAHMASRIAVGIMQDPGPGVSSPESIAEVAVDVAEAILGVIEMRMQPA